MIEQAIFELLSTGAETNALVGLRVFPDDIPQNSIYPLITYTLTGGRRDYNMQGASGLTNPRIQLDLYANTSAELTALKRAVVNVASGYSGMPLPSGVCIYGMFLVYERNWTLPSTEREGPRVRRKQLDFETWFKEA